MRSSLRTRLLLVASLLMAAFFGVTGVVLEQAHVDGAEATLQERLQVYAFTLVAAAEPTPEGGVQIAYPVSEVRFFLPDSGMYARIIRNDGMFGWLSPSMQGVEIPFPIGFTRSERRFDVIELADGSEIGALSVGVAWQGGLPFNEIFTVNVAEDLAEYNAQMAAFRRTLWGWLGVLAVILLAAQWSVLRWGLAPLRRVAADLVAIEEGRKERLDGHYPAELQGLTANLNALVANERERRERYRRALGDLAHSLKTPLAILRGAAEGRRNDLEGFRDTVQSEVGRMSEIVDYQLRRAGTTGRSVMRAAVAPAAVARKVVDALNKAYRDKQVQCSLDFDPEARFHGDEEDLLEIFGNLLDNAYKWCDSRVRIEIRYRAGAGGDGLGICIDDDGPGVSGESAAHLFERGTRAGEGREGHGIGLAMVRDIVTVYGGRVEIGRGDLGGARVTVEL